MERAEMILNRCREEAASGVFKEYLEICRGDEEQCNDFIAYEKENGSYYRELAHATEMNIRKAIRNADDEEIADELRNSSEMIENNKRIATLFANHFIRNKDAYL